ncbi:MAG: host-nuclease inhibitor Gam family protein [Terriglobia bacterium]
MKALTKPFGSSQQFSRPRRIRSWAEADSALAELGKLARQQGKLSARRAQALAGVERQAARLQARARQLAAALEKFSCKQAVHATGPNGEPTTTLAAGRRSRRLVFGRVGFRRVHWLAVRDPERAVAALARNSLSRFLRVETQLDCEALHRCLVAAHTNGQGRPRSAATPQKLARVGIRLKTRDAWFYELHPQAVAR